MMTAAVEPWSAVIDELRPMLPLHYAELALDQNRVPLDPQWHVYTARERAGELLAVVLRDGGDAIGYYWGFIAPGLHYATCLTATMDVFYVHPAYRNGSAGVILFRAVERELQRRGVDRWFVGTKLHADCGALFRRLGFAAVETYYAKWLGQDD
jgi:GNAT superfamily N-acetyltransferase